MTTQMRGDEVQLRLWQSFSLLAQHGEIDGATFENFQADIANHHADAARLTELNLRCY